MTVIIKRFFLINMESMQKIDMTKLCTKSYNSDNYSAIGKTLVVNKQPTTSVIDHKTTNLNLINDDCLGVITSFIPCRWDSSLYLVNIHLNKTFTINSNIYRDMQACNLHTSLIINDIVNNLLKLSRDKIPKSVHFGSTEACTLAIKYCSDIAEISHLCCGRKGVMFVQTL